jgi:DNA-directed RNA polymerase specialized sigma24 family protein
VSGPRERRGGLTAPQWKIVEEALPEARALARTVARRCSSLSISEIETLLEDGLMRRVVDFDKARGPSLVQFSRKFLVLDVLRAAFKRANDPAVGTGLHAADVHEEALDAPDLASQFAESVEEKEARARNLGAGMISAMYYAHEHGRLTRTHEDELVAREEWEELKRTGAAAGKDAAVLLDLLYTENMTWDAAAAKLQVSVATAKRLEERAIERIRGFLSRSREGTAPGHPLTASR